VIKHPGYRCDPWSVCETELHLDLLAQSESVFALSNGHFGMRGNLDEGDPSGVPGTYLAGFHEVRPLPYPETAYGNPEAGETVLNVTDGKIMRLLVDDELFDVRYGELLRHERVLDLRDGVLRRHVHWRSPTGREVRITSTRLVSLTQRGAAAILYEVEPVGAPARLVVQSELIANEDGQPQPSDDDPRAAARLERPLIAEEHYDHDAMVILMHRTERSGLRMGAAMDHLIERTDGTTVHVESAPDAGRVTIAADVPAGDCLRILKFLAYGWSGSRSLTSVRAQVRGSLAEARHTGWDGLCAAQREYLDRFWERADVEIEGDPELQQAVRFALFQILQAGARGERRAIAAKGLTGPGYDGHAFWDTEFYVLPVLTYTWPTAAADALRWRLATLELACQRARLLGLRGAAFPWRTIAGRECSGYWPAGTAAFHIGADIASAVIRYQHAVDDPEFERDVGLHQLDGCAQPQRRGRCRRAPSRGGGGARRR
jgi:alpha,alpha-trehalose phosphorylase